MRRSTLCVAGCRLPVASCQLLVGGCRSAVAGCWTRSVPGCVPTRSVGTILTITDAKTPICRSRLAGEPASAAARFSMTHRLRQQAGSYRRGPSRASSRLATEKLGRRQTDALRCRLLAAGCWLLAAGCQLPVASCQLLVGGCRSAVAGWTRSVPACVPTQSVGTILTITDTKTPICRSRLAGEPASAAARFSMTHRLHQQAGSYRRGPSRA
jgi:hypothetical protein